MKIFFAILQLLYPVAIILIPLLFYRTGLRFPMKFYRSMAYRHAARRAYMMALAVLVLLLNFSFTRTTGPSWWLVPGFLYGLLLLRYSFTDATLRWLHEDRVIQLFWYALIMFTMIMPQMYSLSVALALTFLAAMFYPSRRLLRMVEHPDRYPEFDGTERAIFENYY